MGAMEQDSGSASDGGAEAKQVAPVVLSEGAARALSSVAGRLLRAKRPRPTVLAQNVQVREEAVAALEERRRERENKRARLRFEGNAKVIPDAATDAVLERQLLATATRGAVALFNAVALAQRKARAAESVEKKSKGKPVSKDSFMAMIQAGVANEDVGQKIDDKAAWLKDDFLSSKSKRLKDWDTADKAQSGSVESDDDGEDSASEKEDESEEDEQEFDGELEEEYEDE